MKREHVNALKLEAARHEVPDANALWNDIVFLRSSPIRCMFEFFLRDRYAHTSQAGKRLLCGLLICMESNKSVEDVHQPIRMDGKANQNPVQSKDHIQDLIIHSGSLEARNVPHGAQVTKDSSPDLGHAALLKWVWLKPPLLIDRAAAKKGPQGPLLLFPLLLLILSLSSSSFLFFPLLLPPSSFPSFFFSLYILRLFASSPSLFFSLVCLLLYVSAALRMLFVFVFVFMLYAICLYFCVIVLLFWKPCDLECNLNCKRNMSSFRNNTELLPFFLEVSCEGRLRSVVREH